jgi:hypothetical protein
MKELLTSYMAMTLAMTSLHAIAGRESLCADSERIYFSCRIGKKFVSLCGSQEITREAGYLQYRFGVKGKTPELIYPVPQAHPKGKFSNSLRTTAQTFSYQIGFEQGKYRYRIFIDTAARAESYGDGIFVYNGPTLVTTLHCSSDMVEDLGALERLYRQDIVDRVPPF